jgi:acyl-CoA oxidase
MPRRCNANYERKQTTATFDTETDQFVVHSPTLSSTKFWPGALGFTCSHAIVMARLVISYKDLGIHPFMVQVRSLVDYKPMKGIELGDIGSVATQCRFSLLYSTIY